MLITADDARHHQTPNATMRTLAAPSLGSRELSVWEVAMRAGQQGPAHRADHEQVWVVLGGTLSVTLEARTFTLDCGDTLVIAADARRQIEARADARALVASPAGPLVSTDEAPERPLPWAA